jgi:hypothetical protein
MRVLKIIGVVLLVLVILIGAGAAAVVWGGDPLIARFIQGHGSTLLGREVRIGGNFHIHWGRPIRITAEDVHVANADWGSAPEMFAAKRLELEVQPWPLLHFKYVVPRFELDAPKILLEKSKDGQGNWQFFAAKQATPRKRSQFPDLHLFQVKEGEFTWHNGGTNATTKISFDELKLETPDTASPIAIAAKGEFQHQRYGLQASVGPLAELQDPSKPYPVKLDGTLGATKLAIDGTIKEPMEAEGMDLGVVVEGKNLQDFLAAFTVPVPETPNYRLAGRLKHDGDTWSIERLEGRLGKSRLAGGVAVDVAGQVPYIKANLTSSYLDLADFKGFTGAKPDQPRERDAKARQDAQKSGKKDEKKDQKTDERVIPDTALPVDKLPGINVDFALDAPQVKPTGGLPFDRVTLVMSLKDGTLELKPLRFGIATGEVAAEMRFASRAQPPDVDANIDFRHIDVKKLFGGMDVPDQVKELAGIIGGFIKLKSKGANEREILARADGDVGFFMEGGQFSRLILELMHLDVLESIGWWVQGDKPLPVNCVVTRFDVAQGIATASTFIFDTTDATIEGRGTLNFADETIAMDLFPHHKTPVAITFRSPIHIRGTFGKPSVTLDPVTLGGKIAAAVGLGVLAPPAALLPLINVGLGEKNTCGRAFAAQDDKQRLEDNAAGSGSSKPPQKPERRTK